MPSELFELVAVCRKIRQASEEALQALDRSSVAVVLEALRGLREELETVIERLERLG
jgi:hypothetical protein